ncbi:glycerate kinase type-2 family protein [Aquamicrobium defluvii]|uniref:glycerate kinase type-2 family protein n=1 Tax=Aquamicrobium defluvii TaxID=69279 RepID=UPI000552C436|nr:glycerate kinase [Aquamicrobium defluvii]
MSRQVGDLTDLFRVAIESADPAICVPALLPPPHSGRTIVVAAGKAAASMARAVECHWIGRLEGTAVTRYGHSMKCNLIEVIEAAHPIPDASGENAAKRLLESVKGLCADDLVIALISGGGSALLALPARGITLADKQSIGRQLLASGAPINELNTVRKHLSAIKGGRLAQAAFPAKIVSILISDVPGDDPSAIASGPTVADSSTRQDALRVIERYRIHVPEHVLKYLNDPVSETPKPGNPCFANSRLVMAAKPADMVAAVAAEAQTRGFDVISLGADIEGEARTVGAEHGRMALEIAEKKEAGSPPVLIVSGGETTVSVRNAAGRGGRNLEYLLSLAITVEGSKEISALACDTDGLDGSEDNAGAILDAETLQRARYAGLDPHKALNLNESYSIFKASGGLVITGPTRTNVNDIRLIKID